MPHLDAEVEALVNEAMNEGQQCWLNVEPFKQCCCNCKSLLSDYHHCSTHGRPVNQCVCNTQKGYICSAFADEGVYYSNWPKHSIGCELYEPRLLHSVAVGESEYLSWNVGVGVNANEV